jgi:hypothetical protein
MTNKITPEMINALNELREGARKIRRFVNPTVAELRMADAVDLLDNERVFAAIDEETGYDVVPAREFYTFTVDDVDEIKPDPAEWGDTTRADMARHQKDTNA